MEHGIIDGKMPREVNCIIVNPFCLQYCAGMSRTLTELAEEALALPRESRAFLCEKLLETLDFEEDFPISESWLKEIQTRCHELDSGKVEAVPADTAIADLRKTLG
jgi:hypothetical protein